MRAQSVCEMSEEDASLTSGSLAHGNDPYLVVVLRMGDHYHPATQKAEGDKTLLTVGQAVILEGECRTFEDRGGIDEIEPMFVQICSPLGFVPGEVHSNNYTHIYADTPSGKRLSTTGQALRSEEAERWRSPAAGSRSEERA